jgi:anaerobic magnesium-protoporphyrin IX monomethyl ester cyclase
MSKKIIFVEPRGVKANVFSSAMKLPLLGPIYLASILKKEGYDVTVYNENILGRDISDKELNADVLCLTSLTSTVYRAYDIAKKFRKLNPTSKIIIGGIHASFMKEEAIKYADHVVIGEGETAIFDLIKKGSKEKFIYAKPLDNLNAIPNPDFTVLQNYKKVDIMPVMTSRGCPFGCNFCAVTKMFGRKYRTVSNEKVIAQLQDNKLRTRNVFFYDDNFAANKQRTYSLLDDMRKNNVDLKWSAQVRCDAANDDYLLRRMSEAGCDRVYIGFESVNQKTLESYNKAQSVMDIKKAIKRFHNHNIKIHGMFMLGSDEDDKSIFRKTSSFVNEQDIDFVQYMTLTPLPGTETFFDFEKNKRLLHTNWNYYDGMHVVYKPKNFTPLELQEGMIDCYKDFYSYARTMNLALNMFYESSVNYLSYSSSRLTDFVFNKFGTTTVVKTIIRNWMANNKSYMKYLKSM